MKIIFFKRTFFILAMLVCVQYHLTAYAVERNMDDSTESTFTESMPTVMAVEDSMNVTSMDEELENSTETDENAGNATVMDKETGTVAEADEDAEAVTQADEDAGTVAEADEDVEAVAEADEDAETVAGADEDAEAVAEADEDAEAVAQADEDVEAVAEADEDAETVAGADEDAEAVAQADEDVEAVAEADEDAEAVAEADEDAETDDEAELLGILEETEEESDLFSSIIDFSIDPYNLIERTKAARYGGGTVEPGARVIFHNHLQEYDFSSRSDLIFLENKNSYPVAIKISARIKAMNGVQMLEEEYLAEYNAPAMYLALVDENGGKYPIYPDKPTVITVNLPPCTDDETPICSFGLCGNCNCNEGWNTINVNTMVKLSWEMTERFMEKPDGEIMEMDSSNLVHENSEFSPEPISIYADNAEVEENATHSNSSSVVAQADRTESGTDIGAQSTENTDAPYEDYVPGEGLFDNVESVEKADPTEIEEATKDAESSNVAEPAQNTESSDVEESTKDMDASDVEESTAEAEPFGVESPAQNTESSDVEESTENMDASDVEESTAEAEPFGVESSAQNTESSDVEESTEEAESFDVTEPDAEYVKASNIEDTDAQIPNN